MKTLIIGLMVCALLLASIPAFSIEPIPKESGFSGFLNLGAAYFNVENNMISGNRFVNATENPIDSIFAGPDSESSIAPIINGEIRYTFGQTRTQLYFGNQLEDILRFDFSTLLGVRQELPDGSIGGISYIFSGIPTKVWADPYVAFARRSETDRTSNGLRLDWDNWFGTKFGAEFTWRKISIDNELSGVTGGLGLTPAQFSLLDREGDQYTVELLYTWEFGGGHYIIPAIAYNKFDLDGDAMANDRYTFQFTYGYKGDKFSVVANGFIGWADYDNINPIYGKRQDDDLYGLSLTGFLHRPFGLPKGFSLVGNTGYYKDNANINFYDSQVITVGLSLMYKF
jgi:hypothetical protein